jgi:hypothetical protein
MRVEYGLTQEWSGLTYRFQQKSGNEKQRLLQETSRMIRSRRERAPGETFPGCSSACLLLVERFLKTEGEQIGLDSVLQKLSPVSHSRPRRHKSR